MIKSISAEFESVDFAEIAANRIRMSVGGIRKINITPLKLTNIIEERQNNNSYINDDYTFIPYSITSMNYAPSAIVIVNNNMQNNMDVQCTARLKISCDEQSMSQINKLLISMGGLSVKTVNGN